MLQGALFASDICKQLIMQNFPQRRLKRNERYFEE